MLTHALERGIHFDMSKINPFMARFPETANVNHQTSATSSSVTSEPSLSDLQALKTAPGMQSYLADVTAKMYDELVINWAWWALEYAYFERETPYVDENGEVKTQSTFL